MDTSFRIGTRAVAAGALLLLLAACGQGADVDSSAAPEADWIPGDRAVLQVKQVGGYTSPEMLATRLPVISVYADGRVISQGPQILIYPGPALPNVLVKRISAEEVDSLIDKARSAGVGSGKDFGSPNIADDVTYRFTVTSALGTEVTEVYSLYSDEGLSAEQSAARKPLRDLLDLLSEQAASGDVQQYVPQEVLAVAGPWSGPDGEDGKAVPPAGESVSKEITWPGPALPGEALQPEFGLSCVVVTGGAVGQLLTAAAEANMETPWIAGGQRWRVALRPLLPGESGCDPARDVA
jgi:hypothetical protein